MDTSLLGLNIVGYFKRISGMSNTAQLLVKSMETQHLPYSLVNADTSDLPVITPYPIGDEFIYPTNLYIFPLERIPFLMHEIGFEKFTQRNNIGYSFWETTMFPPVMQKSWDYLDELWTTSNYMFENLSQATWLPVHKMVHPIHLICEPSKNSNKSYFNLNNKSTFLFTWDWCSSVGRKNPQGVVQAFKTAFPSNNDVQLVLKSINSNLRKEKHKYLLNLCADDPRIIYIDEAMSSQDYINLLNCCDFYVSLHRSEGLGLTMAEALLLEKPVIATGYSGNMDFMNNENSYLCSYKLVEIEDDQYPPGGPWAEPNLEHAAELMKYVLENQSEAKNKAKKGKELILKNHSFEVAGKQIKERLKNIF